MTSFTSLEPVAPSQCLGTVKSTKCWPGRFFEISQFDRRPDSSVAGSPGSLTVGHHYRGVSNSEFVSAPE